MNVSEQIIQVIDALCEKFGIAMDWTGENVVPYFETLCEKLVKYEIVTSLASITFMFLFVVGCIIATKKLYPIFKDGVEKDNNSYYDCGWIIGSVFAIIVLIVIGIVAISVFVDNTMDIIKCATFPEMYVFEYVKTLMNAQ